MPYLLATVAAVVVGGNPIGGGLRGSVAATIVGALLLTYLGQLVVAVGFETSAQNIVQAIIIIASVGIVEAGRRIRFEWIRFKFWVTSPDVEFRIRTTFTRTMTRLGTFQIDGRRARGQMALGRRLRPTEEATRNHRMKRRQTKSDWAPRSWGSWGQPNITAPCRRSRPSTSASGAARCTPSSARTARENRRSSASPPGAVRPDFAVIRVAGKEIKRPNAKKLHRAGVAVTFQHPELAEEMTVLENSSLRRHR